MDYKDIKFYILIEGEQDDDDDVVEIAKIPFPRAITKREWNEERSCELCLEIDPLDIKQAKCKAEILRKVF